MENKDFLIESATGSNVCWQVVPQRNMLQLHKQGQLCLTRQLEPRLMQLLCLLADANGNVLSRETLMETLWPRVIVNENSLTRAVSELRKAFVLPDGAGDDVQAKAANDRPRPGLIETVPKRGYRLNARVTLGSVVKTQPLASQPLVPQPSPSLLRQSKLRYSAMAAAILISATLSALATLQLSGTQDATQNFLVAQSSADATEIASAATHALEDRVIGNTSTLPDGLRWVESVHNETDDLSVLQQPWLGLGEASHISTTVVAPGGQMLAFVETFPDQTQIRLRSLTSSEEVWTVFTSSSPITHLQWSPLDAGLLFTVEDKDAGAGMAVQDAVAGGIHSPARLARLMLLDLETLQIRELYRRVVPAGDDLIRTVGNLT